jgi:hypothetical protein
MIMQSKNDFTNIRIEMRPDSLAPTLVVHLSIMPEALCVRETHLGTKVFLHGWPQAGRVGGPGLPARTLRIALPNKTEVSGSLIAETINQSPVTNRTTTLAPIREPRRDIPDRTRSQIVSVARLPKHYRTECQKPRPLVRFLGTDHVGTTAIAIVEVNPVFLGESGNLILATELEVKLPLANAWSSKAATIQTSSAIAPVSQSQFDRLDELARTIVINPADVLGHDRVLRDLAVRWDYLIITDDMTWNAATKTPIDAVSPSIVSTFNILAAWKNSLGLRARVVTVTEIVQSRAGFGLGVDFVTASGDLQDAIRRFLRWAHNTWGTAYVLLGGDDRIVPIRRLSIGSGGHKSMPTDLYYAALNPQNDEWTEGRSLDYGGYGFDRLMPDLSVGRAPASNATEAGNFVTKLKRYEGLRISANDLTQPWLESILYVSTKWGGDDPTEVKLAASFPPGDNEYALDPGRTHAVIKLIDTVHVTQDRNASTTSPSENCFNRSPGKAYVKIHLRPTYKNPQDIVANTASGKITLSHNEKACTTTPGWFYTDWLDNDGPCHDASGQNYASTWIIVYLQASAAVPQSFDVRLNPVLRLDYNLLSKLGSGDYRFIPYDVHAATSGHGWCFSVSATDPTPSPLDATAHQVPTPWLAVYANPQERAPQMFVLDPTEEADTMGEQETLRKQNLRDMPGWDVESALYPDLADVPAADRAGIDLQYYTRDRLRGKLNQGQHIISIGGHGNPSSTCGYGEGGDFDLGLADQLSNAPACGILYANSCLTNRYTEDSLSRHLVMKNPNGGVVAYVGYIDEISIGLGHSVENKFFADLSRTGVLGLAFDARASMVVPGSGFDVNSSDLRYTTFMIGLLGDPALKVHNADREYLVASAVAAAPDAGGQINTIYLRPDHRIAQVKQNPGGWARTAVIDRGSWGSRMALAVNADGRLEVFYIGSDNKLYHIWQTAPNSGWTQSFVLDNGSYAKQLVVGSNKDGRLEVFYIGSDNKLYHIWQTTPNSGWTQSFVLDNGSYAKQVALGSNKDGRLEVFYIGSDNQL